MTANTGLALMTKAYGDAGKISLGQSLSTVQQSDGLDRLNDLIAYYVTKGLKLWLETEQTITLVAGQQLYTMMPGGDVNIPRPYRVKEATYWDASGAVRPLVPFSRADWTIISNRNVQGSVTQYFPERLFDRMNFSLWNIPDATAALGYCAAVLLNPATNLTSVSTATNFPIESFLALRWMLADDLATNQPQATQQRCAQKAQFYMSELDAFDMEEAQTTFAPDDRGLSASAFR